MPTVTVSEKLIRVLEAFAPGEDLESKLENVTRERTLTLSLQGRGDMRDRKGGDKNGSRTVTRPSRRRIRLPAAGRARFCRSLRPRFRV